MNFKFKNNKLKLLYTEEKNAHKYPQAVVDNFFEVITIIESAENEQDLYAFKGRRFEKLSGQRGQENQRSLRLNGQWRLIVTIKENKIGKCILIIDIVDYH